MRVTLVSQAQTEENYIGEIEGRRNVLLNDTGRREVLRLKMRLSNYNYDVCFSSPLTRCMETALVSVGDRVKIIPEDRLIEREFGELEGINVDDYNAYKYWDYNLNKTDFGVEGIQDLFKRCEEFINYLKSNYDKEDIIIITHVEVYRSLRHLLLGHKLEGKMLDGRIVNCQVENFEIKKEL